MVSWKLVKRWKAEEAGRKFGMLEEGSNSA
jgi:hypothetical protein